MVGLHGMERPSTLEEVDGGRGHPPRPQRRGGRRIGSRASEGGDGGGAEEREKKHKGPIHIHVTLLFTLEDTGVGIPAAPRDRVFTPFAELHNCDTKSSGGVGSGLSLA